MLTRARLDCLKSMAERANKPNASRPMEAVLNYINNITPETLIELIDEVIERRERENGEV